MNILYVDDEIYASGRYVQSLVSAGHKVKVARDVEGAKQKFLGPMFDLAILDIMMPPSRGNSISSYGGYRSGLDLAMWIKKSFPYVKIVGFTQGVEDEVMDWFKQNTLGIILKRFFGPNELPNILSKMISGESRNFSLKAFIVHGHDTEVTLELKNYLQNTLMLTEPVILHEQPSKGRTIIEKFEEHVEEIDVAFVLLTPDDQMTESLGGGKLRARQNVIFELGYFMAILGRKLGRVILLHKGSVEIPSDIQGLIYIDISDGIEAAGEKIRRELLL